MKNIIVLILILFLAACSQEGLALEGYKDEELDIQTDEVGINKDIYHKGKEIYIKAQEAYENNDLEMFRDIFVEVNNYFVDNYPNPTLDEYKIVGAASDMWSGADAITKTNDDQEQEKLYLRIEKAIESLDSTLDEENIK